MKLHVGERLIGTGPTHQPGGYLVTDIVRETPWYGLYAGKKIFYNFDFASKRVRETDDKEWLDVYLRTLYYPRLDDRADVAQRRTLARTEVAILGNRGSNLWPEPIDLLELENTRDAFTFAPDDDDREPIVVFARPHGQPLGDWQQSAVPVASLLSVLAELLEFVRRAHAEGLLLQGLGPGAILIDRADRVHYIGSDMVTELKDLSRVRRLFPQERYPRGFAAPEFFDAAHHPSPRSDLYAWGTLAYFLFTGHMPWQIAMEQGRPWAQFQDAHFERLEKALRQIPPAHVEAWAEQLGLAGAALLQNWPGNCAAALRWLLHPEPSRRPASADEVRSWMVALPPAQVNAVLALDAGSGETRVYLDVQTIEADAEIEIRRAVGQAAQRPDQGELAYAGPPQPVVIDSQAPLTEEPFFYTVFSRKPLPGGPVYSGGVATRAIEPITDELLALADADATTDATGQLPLRLALCFRAMDPLGLAEILLTSPRPVVRGWALQRLTDFLTQQPTPEATALVRRCLVDVDIDLRRRAAGVVWQFAPERSDTALLALVQAMGQGQLDDAIQAAHLLRGGAIPDDQLQRIIDRLEGERPTTCPLCDVPLPRRERVDHLRDKHDYVEIDGSMMPRRRAEASLWERVFRAGDADAHRQLMILYGAAHGTKDTYVRALEAQLAQRHDLDAPDPALDRARHSWKRWEPWLACVRQVMAAQPVLAWLSRSTSEPVRAVGRALVLPELGRRLGSERLDVADWHRILEETLPGRELLGERMRLCEQLPEVGVDPAKASACHALLQEELPVPCPECAAQVRAVDLELHLRRAHGIFQFRGARRSYNDTRDFLLTCVCGMRPDVPAWRTLLSLAQDRHGAATDERLTAWLCRTIKSKDREQRDHMVTVVADAAARTDAGVRLVPTLLGDSVQPGWKNVARQMALEIVARLEESLPDALWARVKPYLAAKDIPRATRQHAAAGLLRSCGSAGARAVEILESYVSATSKHRAVERLQELEQRIGQSAILDQFSRELEDRIRMTCPRCQGQLERREMVKHLWDKHRLLLEGRRVREPWRVLADWVVDYALEKDPALLECCRELASKTDPAEGPIRLQRLLLRQGVEDRDAWHALLTKVRERGGSLCPHCYAQAPPVNTAPPLPLTPPMSPPLKGGEGGLEGHGFRVQVTDSGLRPRLEIETPPPLSPPSQGGDKGGVLYDGQEPGTALTRLGALLALALPVVAAAFGLLYALFGRSMPLPVLMLVAMGLSLFLGGLVYLFWPQRSVRRRLLSAAWEVLMPELLAQPLNDTAVAFVGGLAATSHGYYFPDDEVLQATLAAVQRTAPNSPTLALLCRMQHVNAAQRGEDEAPLLAERIRQALAGSLSLRVLGPLLADSKDRWPKGRLLRLQALVCARAADAGLEDADLVDLGRVQPAWRALFGAGDLNHIAQLRLFCALRPRWPAWLRQADSVFELALDPAAEKTLAERPDLLLLSRDAPIYIGTRGVWLKDICFSERPGQIAVVQSRSDAGAGYEIVAGNQHIWFSSNPHAVADELEKWLKFYFADFLPQLTKARQPRTGAATKLWRANATPCPECHRLVVPIAGEVGLRIADAEAQLAS